jgi:hypothetical protein
MTLIKRLLSLTLLCSLFACGGGDADPSQIDGSLANAKPIAAPATRCSSGAPDSLSVDGECQKAFSGMSAPPSGKTGLLAPKSAQAGGYVNLTDFFNWAGPAYPIFFGYSYVQGDIFLAGYGTFTYRYYNASGNYLGVLNGVVYVYGPITSYQLLTVGMLSDYYCSVYNCYARTFIPWTGNVNGVVVKDAGNESFAFYSDTRCIYSYSRNQETTNFCLTSGYNGNFAGQPIIVMSAASVSGVGCLAVLADPYGRQIDIYTDAYGIQTVQVLSTYWSRGSC